MAAMVATACARSDDGSDPAARTAAATVTELCLAAIDEQSAAASRRFQSVHGPLHELADDTAQADRTVAARLLEAKQQVEAAIEQQVDPADLRQRLIVLAHASVAALTAVDVAAPAACNDLEPPP
ncbi:MAG TPA: hypothetical protein VGA36_00825 [Nitriliruptorales bacterium]